MIQECCALCRFWQDIEPDHPAEPNEFLLTLGYTVLEKTGYCRRYPPHPLREEGSCGVPLVDMSDWCGEYQAK